jgi:hypothetical protein
MNTTTTTIIYVILHDFTPVEKEFYEMIRLQVEEILPALVPRVSYTLEMLCGESFWKLLNDDKRRQAGKCMVNLVKTGQIPLQMHGCEHQFPRKYMV